MLTKILPTAGMFALALSGSIAVAAAPWQKLAPLPESNGGFVVGEVQGAVVVLGGTNWEGGQKNWLKVVHRLDPKTLRWSSLAPLRQPVAYAMSGTADGALIVAGGTMGNAMFPGTVRVEQGAVGVRDTFGIGVPAVLSAGGLIGDELVFAGGTDDAANIKGLRRDAFAWNIRTGAQRALPPYPGRAFGIAASVVAGGELLVFGGAAWKEDTQSVVNLTEAYAYSPRRNAWRRLSPFPYPVRGHAAVALDDQHLYIAGGFGGEAGEFLDRAFVYRIAEDRYTPAPPLPYRAAVGLVISGGFVYCIGGEDQMKQRTAAVYRIAVAELWKR
jgi:N-acetylneuraminic acid mutarotase